jgi:hypothetical protein
MLAVALLMFGLLFANRNTWHRGPQIFSRELSNRIVQGMSRDEVVAIVGVPSGDYTTKEWIGGPMNAWYDDYDHWVSDEGMISVRFDHGGHVSKVAFFKIVTYTTPSWLDKILDWLRLAA